MLRLSAIFRVVAMSAGMMLALATSAFASSIVTTPHPGLIVAVSLQDGSERTLFHAGGAEVISPTASRNGRRIAFVLKRVNRRGPRFNPEFVVIREQIWVMRGDGGNAHPIREFVRKWVKRKDWVYPTPDTPGGAHAVESLDISDDGSQLVLDKYHWLYTLRANGRWLHYVSVTGAEPQGYLGDNCTGPQFAPGGKRIISHFATEHFEGLGTVPVGGGRVDILKRFGFSPTYSPDGSLIAFVAVMSPPPEHPNWEGEWNIWVMRSDGSGMRPVVREGERGGPRNPDFSADGKRLVFAAHSGLRMIGEAPEDIYMVSVEGGRVRHVARGLVGRSLDNPQWVP